MQDVWEMSGRYGFAFDLFLTIVVCGVIHGKWLTSYWNTSFLLCIISSVFVFNFEIVIATLITYIDNEWVFFFFRRNAVLVDPSHTKSHHGLLLYWTLVVSEVCRFKLGVSDQMSPFWNSSDIVLTRGAGLYNKTIRLN